MEKIIAFFMDPTHAGASLTSAIVFAFIILLAIVLIFLDYRNKVNNRKKYLRSVPASAKIIKVSHSIGNGDYGGLIINITLEVIPSDAPSYEAKNVWCIEPLALPKIKPGDIIAIRIDPKHPGVIYSAEKWAWNLGKQIPLRFGDHVPGLYIDR